MRRVKLLFGQVGEQRSLEGVAGSHGVTHRHRMRCHVQLAVLATEELCAVGTAGEHHQLCVMVQPALGDARWRNARIEQGQVLVADLDQMCAFGECLDPLAPTFEAGFDVEANVRIE